MIDNDVLRDELRSLYPPPGARPDWNDVLRRAGDAPGVPARHVRRWPLWAAIPAVAALLAALAVVAPWSGGPPFAQRALASLGAARYLRVVVEPPDARFGSVVDLRTGTSRASTERRVSTYDSQTGALRETTYVDGVALASVAQSLPNPGLATFLGGYRRALAAGSAAVVGESTYRGRPVELLRFEAQAPPVTARTEYRVRYEPGTTEVVAVDAATYRPLWYRFDSPAVLPSLRVQRGPLERVLTISSSASPAQAVPAGELEGQAEPIRSVTSGTATAALKQPALWLGARVDGRSLNSLRLEQLSSYRNVTGPTIRSSLGLHLVYGGSTGIQVWESPAPEVSYGFVDAHLSVDGPVPSAGLLRIACGLCGWGYVQGGAVWTGELRTGGLYVRLQAPTRALLLAAARALAPAP